MFAVSNKALSQSVIMVDNPETKPVPVKIMNPSVASQNRLPFTQLSVDVSGTTKATITAASNETRVVEYILAQGDKSIKISLASRVFYVFMPPALVSIPPPPSPAPPPIKMVNTYSGALNIVIKSGETCVFEVTSPGSILVSGYTIIK